MSFISSPIHQLELFYERATGCARPLEKTPLVREVLPRLRGSLLFPIALGLLFALFSSSFPPRLRPLLSALNLLKGRALGLSGLGPLFVLS